MLDQLFFNEYFNIFLCLVEQTVTTHSDSEQLRHEIDLDTAVSSTQDEI